MVENQDLNDEQEELSDDELLDDELEQESSVFESVEQFVSEFIAPLYVRPIGSAAKWCPKWWLHAEAVFRFNALWVTYENGFASEDPTFAAKWMTNYADPFMSRLMEPNGTFNGCSPVRGHRATELYENNCLPCGQQEEEAI